MSTKTELYDEEVHVERLTSLIAGKGEEKTTMTEMRSDGGILAAFADDDDIQQLTVASTNIGFVRRYTKKFRSTRNAPSSRKADAAFEDERQDHTEPDPDLQAG